jgi:nucleotide-binding universal stress UspA family protein
MEGQHVFDNSVIGLQDVPTGVEAVNLARRLASPGAKMTLVRVHAGYRVVASSVNNARMNAERGLAESDLNGTARVTGVTEKLAIGSTSVGDGLVNAVNQVRADLVVLSAAHVLSPTESLVSTVTQINAPVAITSFYDNSSAPIQNIGIAYDGSPESDRALTVARRLAGSQGAALTGFQITARQGMGGNQAAARAAEELAAFASTVDLLVIGPRPTRPLRRLLGPGTIEEVIASTTAPLLLVPTHAILPAPATAPTSEDWVAAEQRTTVYR